MRKAAEKLLSKSPPLSILRLEVERRRVLNSKNLRGKVDERTTISIWDAMDTAICKQFLMWKQLQGESVEIFWKFKGTCRYM